MSFPKDIFSRMFSESPKLIYPKHEDKEEAKVQDVGDVLETNLFNVMLSRRSQRKFENRDVEEWKLERFLLQQIQLPLQEDFKALKFIM